MTAATGSLPSVDAEFVDRGALPEASSPSFLKRYMSCIQRMIERYLRRRSRRSGHQQHPSSPTTTIVKKLEMRMAPQYHLLQSPRCPKELSVAHIRRHHCTPLCRSSRGVQVTHEASLGTSEPSMGLGDCGWEDKTESGVSMVVMFSWIKLSPSR